MDWTLEKTVMLVDAVRQYPVLYDGTIASRKKQYAWRLVAQRIGHEDYIDHCKFKWIALKKEYTQFIKSPSPTPSVLAPYMSFLIPFKTAKRKKSDPLNCLKYLIKLTGLVREHPCLYNKKDGLSRAAVWEQIATSMNDGTTGMQCQTRWLRLRNKFSYSLRMGHSVKPKGIEKHLQFLKPYMKILPPPPAAKLSKDVRLLYKLIDVVRGYPILYDMTKYSRDSVTLTWQKVADTLGNGATASTCLYRWRKLRKNYRGYLKFQTQGLQHPDLVRRLSFLKPHVMFKLPAEETHLTEDDRKAQLLEIIGRQCKALKIDVRDRDTIFLLNFLQDMANMDEVQMRCFRIGAVKAAREILDDDATD